MDMRLLFITVFYFSLLNAIAGQPGFSKWFDFGSAANFHNMVLKEDTLIIAGTSKDLTADQWGALFVKMDTNGVMLDYRLHLDTMDGQFAFNQGYPFISTSDGGYLLAGKVFNRESYFIYKLDVNGDIEFFREYYEPPDILTLLPQQIIEVGNGFLVCNIAQLQNGSNDVQITKINDAGEVEWEQLYGEYSKGENVGSIWQEDENTIVLGCSKATDQFVNLPSLLKCGSNWIFAIDSLGSIKWEWQSEPCEGSNIIGLHRTADGGWIYATRHLAAFDQSNWGAAPKFVKRDSQFNLLWERQVAESYWDSNEMIDLKPTPDGNWVGAGLWVLPEPFYAWSNDHKYTPGCLYKVSSEGDSIWVRCDTVPMANHTKFHRYGGLAVLPSGSIVAAGGFEEFIFGVGDKSWAWVTKVDRHGCMEEPCLVTGVGEVKVKEKALFYVYPNPATTHVDFFFQNPAGGRHRQLLITDLAGRPVQSFALPEGETSLRWNTEELPPGVYFYRWITNGKPLKTGKILLTK
ncbi:MAG: hypothetical protein CMN32_00880 [Saprospirales bacterium]|nr:hypothetical protein [Saprospirales bacterium]